MCRTSHEAWSKGLTPPVFWAHADEILAASREKVDGVISRILSAQSAPSSTAAAAAAAETVSPVRRIRKTGLQLQFRAPATAPASNEPTDRGQFHIRVRTASTNPIVAADEPNATSSPVSLSARPGKAGYTAFFAPPYLEPVLDRAQTTLSRGDDVVVAVTEGPKQSEASDLGVAIALILLCAFPLVPTHAHARASTVEREARERFLLTCAERFGLAARMYTDDAELLTPNDLAPTGPSPKPSLLSSSGPAQFNANSGPSLDVGVCSALPLLSRTPQSQRNASARGYSGSWRSSRR